MLLQHLVVSYCVFFLLQHLYSLSIVALKFLKMTSYKKVQKKKKKITSILLNVEDDLAPFLFMLKYAFLDF